MLFNELYLLYEKNKELAGMEKDGETMLLPIAHSTNNAQVEIVIDNNGNFRRAKTVDESDRTTLVPVTEDAGSRGDKAPYPLSSKLIYLSSDYEKYTLNKISKDKKMKIDKKNNDKKNIIPFNIYFNQLQEWANSKYTHPKVEAIFKYINKKTVIFDLTEKTKILELDEDKKLKKADIFIRFIVEPSVNNMPCETWKDISLYNSWINFYLNKKTDKKLCYITGNQEAPSYKHPQKIRNSGDKAKLISSNDERGFTYRGRFANDIEAISIGYETSQKAHNVLRWILKKQGFILERDQKTKVPKKLLVSWGSNIDNPTPLFMNDTYTMFKSSNTETLNQTEEGFAKRLTKAILGYKKDLETSSKIVILSIDSATPGRLSITMFRRLEESSFLNSIERWHKTCAWDFNSFQEKGIYSPSLSKIVKFVYGGEKKDRNGRYIIEANEKILPSIIEKLIVCVIDRKPIPINIVKMAVNKASNPMSYQERYNWNAVLEIACALVKKSKNDSINKNLTNNEYKEVFTMALDENFKDRSYLYGRLLAVADRIEYSTFESRENRQTNAKRYMSAFAQRPYKTWQIIYKKLEPYLNKLNKGESVKYQNLLQNIHDLFEPKDFINNSSLDGIYILGFECQGKDLRYKNVKENNEEDTNE